MMPEPLAPLLIHERVRLEQLKAQFQPHGRTMVRLGDVDTVAVDDVLRYVEDHGFQGSWDETGVVVKITDKSIVCRKDNDKTNRLAKDDRLARRRVVRLGTKAEQQELRELSRRERAEQSQARVDADRQREIDNLRYRVHQLAMKELVKMFPDTMRVLEKRIGARFSDCGKCSWPGREDDHGCLRCSDGF